MITTPGYSNKATGKMRESLNTIRQINDSVKLLSLNARIEAARAGASGKTFAVVAEEMRILSDRVQVIAEKLDLEIIKTEEDISATEAKARGSRLSDLAFNAIEILDRNLYERTADVRWWATEAAFVEACTAPGDKKKCHTATGRMGILLKNYTIYKELILADLNGRVIASGRPEKYRLENSDVSGRAWFEGAKATSSGLEYFVQDVEACQITGDYAVIYSAAVREGGETNGKMIGVLAVVFDWDQADCIVKNVRLSEEEKAGARVVLFNKEGYVIASGDGKGVLRENLSGLEGVRRALKGEKGFAVEKADNKRVLVAFAHTPGYETYRGLGWGCAIIYPLCNSVSDQLKNG